MLPSRDYDIGFCFVFIVAVCGFGGLATRPLTRSTYICPIVQEVAVIPTKRLRNKIAGFITHLMKRIQKGPVRGISIKLQEEERERRDNFVPEISALEPTEGVEIDAETEQMLKDINFSHIADLRVVDPNKRY